MKTVTIRELHEKTGHWVREAEEHEQIIITDRGRPIAALSPFRSPRRINRIANRKILPGFKKFQGKLTGGTDSTVLISNDRDGR